MARAGEAAQAADGADALRAPLQKKLRRLEAALAQIGAGALPHRSGEEPAEVLAADAHLVGQFLDVERPLMMIINVVARVVDGGVLPQ